MYGITIVVYGKTISAEKELYWIIFERLSTAIDHISFLTDYMYGILHKKEHIKDIYNFDKMKIVFFDVYVIYNLNVSTDW